MRISTLIVEDEPLSRQTLRDFISEFQWLEVVGEACDGLTAVELINNLEPQLIFLDVQIPELSGLEVLRRIRYRPLVIFTTAFDNYAIKAFELEALDYLQKPFGRERFKQTIGRAFRILNQQKRQFSDISSGSESTNNSLPVLGRLFVRDKQRILPLPVEEILWLKADDDFTVINTAQKKFLVTTTLKEFSQLLDQKKFWRIHRSIIVNLEHIRQLEEFDRRILVYMSNGTEIQASRAGSQLLKKLIT